MAGAPDFKIEIPQSRGLSATLQTVQPYSVAGPPSDRELAGVNVVAAAGEKFGAALADLGVKIKHAQDQTQVAVQTRDYLTRLDELEQEHNKDPDFQNAPGNFEKRQREIEAELSANIQNDAMRQKAVLEWRRAGLSAGKRVQATAWTREVDANVAGLDSQETEAARSAAAAASPVERAGAVSRYGGAVKDAVASGWISEQEAVKREKRFARTLDLNDVYELTRTDAARAGALLDDPKMFPNIDPLERQQLINAAKSQADTQGQLRVTSGATFNPAGAALTAGSVTSPAHGRSIFDRITVQIESGGDNSAISPKGAAGVSQIMPATAREVAKKLGLADVAALGDDALTARLTSDKELNYRLGLTYWNELTQRYGGNLPATFAAYNAGPSRADRWVKQAVEQFGPGYTPAQFAQVVDIKETKDYLVKAWKTAGADMNGAGLSPEGRLRTAAAVGQVLNSDESERIRIVKEVARADRTLNDPAAILKIGNDPDPTALALTIARQTDAANAGDVEAAKAVKEIRFRQSLQPIVRQAYATSPVELDQAIAGLEAQQASGPVTTDAKNRLDALREVRDEVKKRAHAEPLALYSRAGLAPQVAVDVAAQPEDAGFRKALAMRGAQAISAQQLYKGSANALMGEEARALKERYSNAGADEQFRMLSAFGATLQGQAYEDTVAAVVGKNDGVALTVGRIAATRPELARDILVGAKLMDTKEVNDKAALVRPALEGKLAGQVFPSADMQDSVVNAALALYTARRATSGGLYSPTDGDGIGRALEEITGPIVKRNGRRTPIAPGIQPRAFNEALDHLSEREVTLMGGAYGRGGAAIPPAELGDRAQLVPLAPGSPRYAVLMPTPDGKGAPVLTYDGTPMIMDMRQIVGSVKVPLTANQKVMRDYRAAAAARLQETRRQVEATEE